MSLKKILATIIAISAFSLAAATIIVSARYSDAGDRLKVLDQKKRELEAENRRLEQLVLENTSLTLLQEKADAQGFSPPEQVITVTDPTVPVAFYTE